MLLFREDQELIRNLISIAKPTVLLRSREELTFGHLVVICRRLGLGEMKRIRVVFSGSAQD